VVLAGMVGGSGEMLIVVVIWAWNIAAL